MKVRSTSPRPSRLAILAMVLMRVLAAWFTIELSGVAHAGLDVASELGFAEHPDDDCDESHECPPGCTSCHCAHGVVASSSPRIEVELELIQPDVQESGFVPSHELPLTNADLTPLYRPPRTHVVS